jgi:hypothetical protein
MSDHMQHHQHPTHAHDAHDGSGVNAMAASATLHCLTGCAIGEIAGLILGTALGLGNGLTVVLSVALAFFFGYTISTLPLLRAGLAFWAALSVVLAADTLSIATMEVVDNLVMVLIPGAMGAGLVDVTFWISMMLALSAAFFAAYPVNRYLLQRGKGHALTHGYHDAPEPVGPRRLIPTFSTGALVAVIAAFLLGGLVVSTASALGADDRDHGASATHSSRLAGTPAHLPL